MRHRHSILLTILLLCLASQVFGQDRFWRSYVEWETRGGELWTGQGNLFVPMHQTQVNILFLDVRGNWNDTQAAHGNLGLAFRQMLIHDWILGIHGAYDTSHSALGNNFHQGTVGVEMLNPDWGLRWNGYFVGEGAQLLPSLNTVSLVGNNLVIQQASERAYSGQDFNIERRLWYRSSPGDGRWRHWVNSREMEIWGSIGVFHFENDAAGFEDITGPRARLEMRLFDVPLAGPDSRLVLGGQWEHDDVRGSVGSGLLNLRIPFGRGTSGPPRLLRGLNRRMVAPIVRNTDIISVAGFEAPEAAAFTRTGQPISQVVTIDANTINPEVEVATAGSDSLVIVDGAAGTILPATTIDVQSGQVLMGGGSNLSVTGLTSGATATFLAPGSRPTFDSALNSTFNTADDSTLLGLDINNSGDSIAGALLNTNMGVLIEDVGFNATGLSSVGIDAISSQFSVNNSMISTSGQFGNGIRLAGDNVVLVSSTSIATSGPDAEGILVADNSFLNLSGSRIFTSGSSGSEGILATDSAQLIVNNSVVTTIGPSTVGILALPGSATDTLALSVLSSTVNATSHGIVLGGPGFVAGTLDATVVANSISSPTGSNEIEAETNGTAVLNLSAQGNVLDPVSGTIRLNEIGGDINVSQSAPGSGAKGIDTTNGLPSTNVLIPGNAIDFDQPPPVGPMVP